MRYVKARKRGQPLTCYRFAAAAADWCLRALYCSLTGQGELDGKLSTEEYATLDRMDTDNRGLAILAVLDYTEPARMDRTVCGIFREMHDLCCEIALTRGETLPDAVFQRMLAFLHEELAAT